MCCLRLLFLLIILSSVVHAFDLTTDDNGIVANPPICIVDGEPVKYIQDREHIWRVNVSIALAYKDKDGNKFIYYDPIAFSETPPEFQVWVWKHECLHHLQNHLVSIQGYFADRIIKNQERDADCYATRSIIEAGFIAPQVKLIYNVIKDEDFLIRNSPPRHRIMRRAVGSADIQYRASFFKQCVIQSQK